MLAGDGHLQPSQRAGEPRRLHIVGRVADSEVGRALILDNVQWIRHATGGHVAQQILDFAATQLQLPRLLDRDPQSSQRFLVGLLLRCRIADRLAKEYRAQPRLSLAWAVLDAENAR